MSRSSLKIKAGTSNENLPEEREDEEEENEEKRVNKEEEEIKKKEEKLLKEKKERREEDCSEAILLSFHGMVEQNTDEANFKFKKIHKKFLKLTVIKWKHENSFKSYPSPNS